MCAERSSGSSELGLVVFHRPYRRADGPKLDEGRPVHTQSLLLLTFLGKFRYICQDLDKMTIVSISCCRVYPRFQLRCIFSFVIENYLDTEAQWNSFSVFARMGFETDSLTYVKR